MALELTIVTPAGEVLREDVDRVFLPGSEGEFGVLAGHERFLTPLRIGEVQIVVGGRTRHAAISEGFADVGPDEVVALVDAGELAEEIDVPRAEAARDRARAALEELPPGEREERSYRMQELALQRALVRLQVAGKAAR
jgi:F-type H+-transporting ATPase subunit epsilon